MVATRRSGRGKPAQEKFPVAPASPKKRATRGRALGKITAPAPAKVTVAKGRKTRTAKTATPEPEPELEETVENEEEHAESIEDVAPTKPAVTKGRRTRAAKTATPEPEPEAQQEPGAEEEEEEHVQSIEEAPKAKGRGRKTRTTKVAIQAPEPESVKEVVEEEVVEELIALQPATVPAKPAPRGRKTRAAKTAVPEPEPEPLIEKEDAPEDTVQETAEPAVPTKPAATGRKTRGTKNQSAPKGESFEQRDVPEEAPKPIVEDAPPKVTATRGRQTRATRKTATKERQDEEQQAAEEADVEVDAQPAPVPIKIAPVRGQKTRGKKAPTSEPEPEPQGDSKDETQPEDVEMEEEGSPEAVKGDIRKPVRKNVTRKGKANTERKPSIRELTPRLPPSSKASKGRATSRRLSGKETSERIESSSVLSPAVESQFRVSRSPTPPRQTRGQRKNEVQEKPAVVPAARATRSKKNSEEPVNPPVKATRGRKGTTKAKEASPAPEIAADASETIAAGDEPIRAPVSRPTRGRKAAAAVEADVTTGAEPQPENQRRGTRKGQKDTAVAEQDEEQADSITKKPARSTRSKAAPSPKSTVALAHAKRGRKAATPEVQEVNTDVEKSHDIEKEPEEAIQKQPEYEATILDKTRAEQAEPEQQDENSEDMHTILEQTTEEVEPAELGHGVELEIANQEFGNVENEEILDHEVIEDKPEQSDMEMEDQPLAVEGDVSSKPASPVLPALSPSQALKSLQAEESKVENEVAEQLRDELQGATSTPSLNLRPTDERLVLSSPAKRVTRPGSLTFFSSPLADSDNLAGRRAASGRLSAISLDVPSTVQKSSPVSSRNSSPSHSSPYRRSSLSQDQQPVLASPRTVTPACSPKKNWSSPIPEPVSPIRYSPPRLPSSPVADRLIGGNVSPVKSPIHKDSSPIPVVTPAPELTDEETFANTEDEGEVGTPAPSSQTSKPVDILSSPVRIQMPPPPVVSSPIRGQSPVKHSPRRSSISVGEEDESQIGLSAMAAPSMPNTPATGTSGLQRTPINDLSSPFVPVSALGSPTKSAQTFTSSPITVRDFEMSPGEDDNGIATSLKTTGPQVDAESGENKEEGSSLLSEVLSSNEENDTTEEVSFGNLFESAASHNGSNPPSPAVGDVTEGDSTFNRWLEGDSGYTDVNSDDSSIHVPAVFGTDNESRMPDFPDIQEEEAVESPVGRIVSEETILQQASAISEQTSPAPVDTVSANQEELSEDAGWETESDADESDDGRSSPTKSNMITSTIYEPEVSALEEVKPQINAPPAVSPTVSEESFRGLSALQSPATPGGKVQSKQAVPGTGSSNISAAWNSSPLKFPIMSSADLFAQPLLEAREEQTPDESTAFSPVLPTFKKVHLEPKNTPPGSERRIKTTSGLTPAKRRALSSPLKKAMATPRWSPAIPEEPSELEADDSVAFSPVAATLRQLSGSELVALEATGNPGSMSPLKETAAASFEEPLLGSPNPDDSTAFSPVAPPLGTVAWKPGTSTPASIRSKRGTNTKSKLTTTPRKAQSSPLKKQADTPSPNHCSSDQRKRPINNGPRVSETSVASFYGKLSSSPPQSQPQQEPHEEFSEDELPAEETKESVAMQGEESSEEERPATPALRQTPPARLNTQRSPNSSENLIVDDNEKSPSPTKLYNIDGPSKTLTNFALPLPTTNGAQNIESAETPTTPRQPKNDDEELLSSSPFEEDVPIGSPEKSSLKRRISDSPIPAKRMRIHSPRTESEEAQQQPTIPQQPAAAVNFAFEHSNTPRRRRQTTTGFKTRTPSKKPDTWFGMLGLSPANALRRKQTAETRAPTAQDSAKRTRTTADGSPTEEKVLPFTKVNDEVDSPNSDSSMHDFSEINIPQESKESSAEVEGRSQPGIDELIAKSPIKAHPRRHSYLEAAISAQAQPVDRPATPNRRTAEPVQSGPDSITRRQYGRRLSWEMWEQKMATLQHEHEQAIDNFVVKRRVLTLQRRWRNILLSKTEEACISKNKAPQSAQEHAWAEGLLDKFDAKWKYSSRQNTAAKPLAGPSTSVEEGPKISKLPVSRGSGLPQLTSRLAVLDSVAGAKKPPTTGIPLPGTLTRKLSPHSSTPSPSIAGKGGIKVPTVPKRKSALAPVHEKRIAKPRAQPRQVKTTMAKISVGPAMLSRPKKEPMMATVDEGLKRARANMDLNRTYSCKFKEEVAEISRPPSPSPAEQARKAAASRLRRRIMWEEEGLCLGAGEDGAYMPEDERTKIQWTAPLEADYDKDVSERPMHSPKTAKTVTVKKGILVKKKIPLDADGNEQFEDSFQADPDLEIPIVKILKTTKK